MSDLSDVSAMSDLGDLSGWRVTDPSRPNPSSSFAYTYTRVYTHEKARASNPGLPSVPQASSVTSSSETSAAALRAATHSSYFGRRVFTSFASNV